jgi:hypothetical protein
MTVVIAANSDYPVSEPPSDIALSRDGSLAIIVRPVRDEPHLLVVRANGARSLLSRPDDRLLARTFRVSGVLKPNGTITFPTAKIAAIAFADDGTIFATISSSFAGGYIGTEEAVYAWHGGRWFNALSASSVSAGGANSTIGAAESDSRFVWNGNFAAAIPDLDASARDPHFRENFAVSVQDRKSLSLAFGSATAMRAQFVVGYFAGERSVPNFDPTHSVVALRWVHGRRKSLGPGIAYGVNRSGTVVGNDSRELDDLGRPTLWRGDHRFALSSESGSAYAIADDGIVVGATGNSAFIARSVDKRSTFNVTPLDRRVRGTGWHITGAYAIDAKGRILAAGYRTNGTLQVLLLDPRVSIEERHKRIWARDRHPTPKSVRDTEQTPARFRDI